MDLILRLFCILNFVNIVRGRCYFPGELQGIWATQAAPDVTDAPIAYSMVTIDADHVSTWGQCHSKINDDIILAANRSGPHSAQCFRCFRLVVASVNVAALVSGGLETCFASVNEALLSCPTTERGAAHLVLYKVGQSRGVAAVQETQCPFSGIYFFSYEKGTKGHRGSGNPRCEQPTSEMSNCPFGFSLSLQYRDCTFDNPRAANWHCLGSWEGLNGQKYTTFLDMDTREGDGKPKYKCGIYRQDKNGRVFLSFSRDSTCVNDLVDAENGHERYVLYTAAVSPLPNTVRDRPCRFPSSLRGEWHNTLVEISSIAFKNEQSFNSLHMQCTKDMGDSEKYVVYTRTDCGKWYYNCIMIKRRSANIIEFKLGERRRETLHPDLCDSREFNNLSPWITRAKTRIEDPTVCPIVGSYKGDLPDSPGYCAELYSDCSRKDHMYYAIDECSNPRAVYEQSNFPRPQQVKPGVFIPPERFDKTRPRPANPPYVGPRLPGGVPPEIQVGSDNRMHQSRRSEFAREPQEVSIQGQATLRIVKKRKKRSPQPSSNFLGYNPRTTTISFSWGQAPSPTTPRPRVNRVSNSSLSLNHNNLRNLESFGAAFDSHSRLNSPQLPFDRQSRVGFDDGQRYNFNGGQLGSDYNVNLPPFPRSSFEQRGSFNQNNRGSFDQEEIRNPIRNFPRNSFNDQSRGSFQGSNQARLPIPLNDDPGLRPLKFTDERQSDFDTDRTKFSQQFYESDQRVPNPNFESAQISNDLRSDLVRPLPATNSGLNPLGFWPNGERREQNNDPSSQHMFTDNPVFDKEPSVPGKISWVASPSPPSPVGSWVEIKDFSSPSKLTNERKQNPTKTKILKEEREYQCLGQWEEEGNIYALTRRKDIHTYECFVGRITDKGFVFMKETGSSCRRGVRPDDFGMKTVMKSECPVVEPEKNYHLNDIAVSDEGWRESQWRSRSRAAPPTKPPWVPSTRRTWDPIALITGRPNKRRNAAGGPSSATSLITFSVVLVRLFSLLRL